MGDGEALVDVGAGVAVTDSPHANHVLVGSEAQALKLLDEVQGASDVPGLLGDEEIVVIDVIIVVVIDIDVFYDGLRLFVLVVVLGQGNSGDSEEGSDLHHFLRYLIIIKS